ncbi:MAG: hypothetical protein Q4D38_09375 [Planctomycetia bacterium]|nr:hypothetical protein [Planctomycetia bacterium]
MKKSKLLVVVICMIMVGAMSTGCRLCCAPYDYCGPVYAGGKCSNLARFRCGTAFRRGCATCETGCASCQAGAPMMAGAPMVAGAPAPNYQYQVRTAPGQQMPIAQAAPQRTLQRSAPTTQVYQTPSRPVQTASQIPAGIQTATGTQLSYNQGVYQNAGQNASQNGYQRVQVFDEKGTFLGYEMIDASGRNVTMAQAPTMRR